MVGKHQLSTASYPDICHVRSQAETLPFETEALSLFPVVVVAMATAILSQPTLTPFDEQEM